MIKDKKKQYCKLILFLLFITMLPFQNSMAASGLKLNYDSKNVVYQGQQVKYQWDGKNVKLGSTPGIIINGISLVSYKEVFGTAIGATCKFTASTGTITISKNNVTVKMKLGSRTAYINNKKKTLSVAPKKIQYIAAKTTKIAVPARFVAEALGYSYLWNSSTSTVKMTSPYQLFYDGKWNAYHGIKGKVAVDEEEIDVSKSPTIILDNTVMLYAQKVFTSEGIGAYYKYDSATSKVTISNAEATIVFKLGSKTASVNEKKYSLETAPRIVKNNVSKKDCVMVPGKFTVEMLGYHYQWDNKSNTANISTIDESPELGGEDINEDIIFGEWKQVDTTISNVEGLNLLTSLKIESKGKNELITLTGNGTINGTVSTDSNDSNCVFIDISGMKNAIEDIKNLSDNLTESQYIKNVILTQLTENSVRLQVNIVNGCEYYMTSSGNTYVMSIFKSTQQNNPNTNSNYAISFLKPDSVKIDDITNEDRYYNNQFVITLPGDYVDFYDRNPIQSSGTMINNVSCTINSNGNTDITVTTNELQGYKLIEEGENIYINVGNPKDIYQNIVVLDPGHGGSDPGASSGSNKEKDITYKILYQYAKSYFNNPESNIKAYWTRENDSYIALTSRSGLVSKVGADLFISLHMNSASSAANGTEVYYAASNNKENSIGLKSQTLANYFLNNLPPYLGLNNNRGVKTAEHVVTKTNTSPAILIELGFLTNPADLQKITNPTVQQEAASKIYEITEEIFGLYPTGR